MKITLVGILSLSLLIAACGQSTPGTTTAKTPAGPVTEANAAKMKFDSDAFDFGKIKPGDKVTHEYKFVNNGVSPLIITDSYATCGCTKPEWPSTPVKPGDSGVIKVTFNSAGKSGLQDKQVTIVANTIPANTVVHLVGEVVDNNTKK